MKADGVNVETAAYNLNKERSVASEASVNRTHTQNLMNAKAPSYQHPKNHYEASQEVDHSQKKGVFQRADTQNLISTPFKAEVASQSLLIKTRVATAEEPRRGLSIDTDDEHCHGSAMELKPSESSGEMRENLRQYWESQGAVEKRRRKFGNVPEVRSSAHMGLVLPDRDSQPRQEMGHLRATERYETPLEPNPRTKGSTLVENRSMDGVVFSIESEDDSLLKDEPVQATSQPSKHRASRMLYDGPVPSARSSFSMARSRQLSLVDSVLSEDDTMSTVTAVTTEQKLSNTMGIQLNEQKQIGALIDRLNHVEKRNAIEVQDPSVDLTIADEISEIKSLLQGLQAQTSRRINQQDPPPDSSKTKRDAPDGRRDAPDKYGGDAPDSFFRTHSSGSSTASSSYVKHKLRQPDPVDNFNTATPRSAKAANVPASAPRIDTLNRTPTFGGDAQDIRTAPQPSRKKTGAISKQEPRQLSGASRSENQRKNSNVDRPADGTVVSVKDRVRQFSSVNESQSFVSNGPGIGSQTAGAQAQGQFGHSTRGANGSHVGRQEKIGVNAEEQSSYIGSQASYRHHFGSQLGVEQTHSQFGQTNRVEHGSYIGNQASYSHHLGSQLGVEQTHSQFGRTNAEEHSSYIGSQTSYRHHIGVEQVHPQFGRTKGEENNSYIGSQASYGHHIGSQLGVEQTHSQFGRPNAAEHSSYIQHQASYGHHVGSQPGMEHAGLQFGRNNMEEHSSYIGGFQPQIGVGRTHSQFGQLHESHKGHNAGNQTPHAPQNATGYQSYSPHLAKIRPPHPRPVHRPLHQHGGDSPQQALDEFFYSRTESDLTNSIAPEPENQEKEASATRHHKSSRAASYFDTLSVGVKAGGSFDSVSDRSSSSTHTKKRKDSTRDSRTNTMASDNSTLETHTLDTVSASRSPNSKEDTKTTVPNTESGFRDRIYRNAKSHIEKMSKKGDIGEPFKARVMRAMDPLVGNSSSDDDEASTIREEKEDEERGSSPKKGYLPACHFFCG
jgi:hypothetical protein